MQAFAAVAGGGAIGALLRYWIAFLIAGQWWPWATMAINILGSLFIGMMWAIYAEAEWFVAWGRLFFVVGVLGGFTTFSTFSYDAMMLVDANRHAVAVSYVMLTVASCLAAVWIGHRLGSGFVA